MGTEMAGANKEVYMQPIEKEDLENPKLDFLNYGRKLNNKKGRTKDHSCPRRTADTL